MNIGEGHIDLVWPLRAVRSQGTASRRVEWWFSCFVRLSLCAPIPVTLRGVPGIGHYEAIRKEIIRLLREEREHRKISNYVVAQNSGVSESMLSLVERELRNPTMELMLRIADGVGEDLPALIEKATATVQKKRAKVASLRRTEGASARN